MDLYEEIGLIEGVFIIKSHRNTGAAFGILEGARWFFIIITIVVVIGIIIAIQKVKHQQNQRLITVGLSLILAGAIGNFIDRAMTGEVVDFFYFVLIDFPIFNVADSAIVVGVGLFLLDAIVNNKKEDNSKEEKSTVTQIEE